MKYNSGVARKPAVFVSSTCYDLKEIRQNIREFIENLGYEAILSEYDSFPISGDIDTTDNCLRVVEERADILILVIGGRYGYITDRGSKSITNLEYLRARTKGIPIFVFIDQSIINMLPVWNLNPTADFSNVVDSSKIFNFVEDVRKKDSNWVHEFDSGKDIITCLRKQLAYLVNDSLLLRKHCNKGGISPKILQYSGRVFELAVEKPDYWKYLLFAEALKDNLGRLDDLRYDLKYGISLKGGVLLDESQEVFSFFHVKIEELLNRIDFIDTIINKALEEALGKTGVTGDADYIIYVAEKLIDVYKSVHEWSLAFKNVIVPEEFKDLILYSSELSLTVIEDIESFISNYNHEINRVIMEIDEGLEYRTITFSLKLRAPDIEKVNREIKRLGGI